jgi:predicted RNase H-like nuclease (RuvC/YqgF family)
MTMIGLPRTDAPVIEVDGKQYAQLPEGWPAAEAKDLEEAHAASVMEDDDGLTEREREIYNLTPGEVKELLTEMVSVYEELHALRKGMKTMQRKTRKQAQVQRRLERRLSQARAGREQLRDQAEQYRGIALVNQDAALELSLQQLRAGETVQL